MSLCATPSDARVHLATAVAPHPRRKLGPHQLPATLLPLGLTYAVVFSLASRSQWARAVILVEIINIGMEVHCDKFIEILIGIANGI